MCLFLRIAVKTMKSKKISLLLSLLGASAGADRFYLGQNTAGWVTLLTFWVLIPGAVYGLIKLNLFPNCDPIVG